MIKTSTRSLTMFFALVFASALNVCAQEPAKPAPKGPEAEVKAVAAINAAPDATAKLTLAEAFVKKYPKSTLRAEVARYVTAEIARVTDAKERLSLAERLQKAFSNDAEQEGIRLLLIDGYVRAKRVDDAFTLGASMLAKQPGNLSVLSALAIAGTEEVRKQNNKYAGQSLQYGLKSIEIIEAKQKPANLDEETWTYEQSLLPRLYLDMGTLGLAASKPAEAKPRLEKAIALNPSDPLAYVFLGELLDDEYRVAAEAYQGMSAGPQKTEALKKATGLMDQVIDLYAHALGTASGKPEFKETYDKVLEMITPYFRYRRGSTSGLQALIDKYKVPATP